MTDSSHPLRDALFTRFGRDAFGDGVFYAHAPALRFELSRGGGHVELFLQAMDRGREILAGVFPGGTPLVAVLVLHEPPSRATVRRAVTALRRLGVRPERPRAVWAEPPMEEEMRRAREDADVFPGEGDAGEDDGTRTFVAFSCGTEAVPLLLWGAAAADLGVRPRLPGRVYLADVAGGLLAHPYDDRGMDVVGPNHARLAELHRAFAPYLLDHDRARMAAFFAPPAG
jgi:hypothetical protein